MTEIRGDEAIPSILPGVVRANTGRWEITFETTGRYTVSVNGYFAVQGEYRTTEAQIVVGQETGTLACRFGGVAWPGTYSWAFDGKMLTLTKVADDCVGRVVVFTAHPWARRD